MLGDEYVSFVPMEGVGEYGGLSLDKEKTLDDIGDGYTYFADGDVVIAKITPCFENGKGALAAGLTNGAAFGTTELHVVRAGPNLDRCFLFYLTISPGFRDLGEAHMYGAGGQKRVPEAFIKDFRTPLPPLDEQRAIVRFLDAKTAEIDALIARKQRLLELLAEQRSALITKAVTKGPNPNAPMKPSGLPWLGDIPAHWEVKRLRFVMEKIEQGWSPQCHAYEAGSNEWGVLKVGCVNGSSFEPSENKALPEALEPLTRFEIQVGDILMSHDPKDIEYRVEDDVSLKYYRLQQISSGTIGLQEGEAEPLKGPTEVGTRRATDDAVPLSTLIEKLNERFGTDFKPADQLFFDQVAETAAANETLQAAAKVNKMEDFAYVFNRMLEGLFIERMEGNEDIFNRLMKDDEFRTIAASHLVREVYERLRNEAEGETAA